ncbi:MAG TPA: phytanoyl-CoA dioxygenase family protein [Thermoanaerobaculia bacterium]|nr:phytanoyl-CoA dioxygenase family protein [Thermoanaerobaculia bacterium]
MPLTPTDISRFVTDGFLRVDGAFPRPAAEAARAILWRDTGADPADRGTWTQPVVWLGEYGDEPFRLAFNAPELTSAYDALVGAGRWLPRVTLGSFMVRFPSDESPGDDGWHVDASFPGPDAQSFFDWRINHRSRGRALLLLFLFSDVGEDDAPTRIRVGSHADVARLLAPVGEDGLSFRELAAALGELPPHEEVLATGPAGTVYLCHPFLMHAAQQHRGTQPRFMAQPALLPREELAIDGPSPVEQAIRRAAR